MTGNIDRIKIKNAIKKAKYGKAAGVDDITVEELEAATIGLWVKALLRLFREIWGYEVIPTEWKHSVIICKQKKDKLGLVKLQGY